MTVTDDLTAVLAARHEGLLDTLTAQVIARWLAHIDVGDDDWVDDLDALVAGAAVADADLVAGYAQAWAQTQGRDTDLDVDVDGLLARIDVGRWADAPALRFGKLLNDGVDPGQARATAGRYAGQLAGLDVQHAHQGAFEQVSGQLDVRMRRVPSAGACGFCQVVADQTYRRIRDIKLHRDCRCTTALYDAGGDWTPGEIGKGWQDVIGQRADAPADLADDVIDDIPSSDATQET